MNKRDLLYKLGRAIRKHPEVKEVWKKHGSYWTLKLESNIYLFHDDCNNAIKALYPDGKTFYFGLDFGRFEASQTSELHLQSTIELVESDKGKPISENEADLVYKYL